jgi:hypothetical protein
MTYFLRKLGISIGFFLLLTPICWSSHLEIEEDSPPATAARPVESALLEQRISGVESLTAVLQTLKTEQEIQLSTYEKLKSGEDAEALGRSVQALRDLRIWTLSQCRLLTGLTDPEGAEKLRVKRKFFTDIQGVYAQFLEKALAGLSSNTEKGSMTLKKGQTLGSGLAQVAQQKHFYEWCIDTYIPKLSGDNFQKEGRFGVSTGVGALDQWMGSYFIPKNENLTFFVVRKEEKDAAKQITSLLKKFHTPLQIEGDIDYGPYTSDVFDEAQGKLEGKMTLKVIEIFLQK